MFFDTITGDVYVNSSKIGELGEDPVPRATLLFSPATAGQIEWIGGMYAVVTGPIDYAQHPIAGVSWYGALKYCNWLTLDQGMSLASRCYAEDTESNLTGWHPATISSNVWAGRDLNDSERLDLVSNYRGYRLPMDDGCANAIVDSDQSDAYNEWYKAASRKPDDDQGDAVFGAIYGFGRDSIAEGDANFKCSGDPFEDEFDCADGGTTPVGYFDGLNTLRDGTLTSSTDNPYGLFDLSGNVYEWMQGRFTSDPGSIASRTLRGGRWQDTSGADSLQAATRTHTESFQTVNYVGFRVVRTLITPSGDINQDGTLDHVDYAGMFNKWSGPNVNIAPSSAVFDMHEDGDIDLRDFAAFQNAFATAP
jgi:hypothetical protein